MSTIAQLNNGAEARATGFSPKNVPSVLLTVVLEKSFNLVICGTLLFVALIWSGWGAWIVQVFTTVLVTPEKREPVSPKMTAWAESPNHEPCGGLVVNCIRDILQPMVREGAVQARTGAGHQGASPLCPLPAPIKRLIPHEWMAVDLGQFQCGCIHMSLGEEDEVPKWDGKVFSIHRTVLTWFSKLGKAPLLRRVSQAVGSHATHIEILEKPIFRGDTYSNDYHALYAGKRVIARVFRQYRDEDAESLVQESCRTVANLQVLGEHSAILPLIAVLRRTDRSLIIVFPYKPWTLREMMRMTGPVGEGALVLMLSQVAKGLAYFHSRRIMHGNLKTSNILVDDDGQVFVVCSGSSIPWVVSPNPSLDSSNPLALKLSESLRSIGAQMEGLDVDSFGRVVLETYTSHENHIQNRGRRVPVRPTAAAGDTDMSDRVWKLVLRCSFGLPSDRPTAFEIVEMLGNFVPIDG